VGSSGLLTTRTANLAMVQFGPGTVANTTAEVYMRSCTVAVPWPSHLRFTWQSAFSFPAIPAYPGTQWIFVSIPISRRVLGLWLIHLANGCPGQGSRCSVHRMAACELLKTATFVTLCFCSVSLFPTDSQSASPIAHSSASQISTCLVPR